MSTPKLYYFDLNGRASVIRLLFAVAGAKYEDIRFDASAFAGASATGNTTVKFADYKATTPYGQAPILEVNGVKIAQSRAIERYVAKQNHLYGADDVQGALIDATQEQLRDLYEAFSKAGQDAAAKSEFVGKLGEKAASLAKQLEHSKGFLVGDKVSYADITFLVVFEAFKGADAKAFEAHVAPSLKAHLAKIETIPAVAKHLAERPVRPF
jgi:glutathione S-transferase